MPRLKPYPTSGSPPLWMWFDKAVFGWWLPLQVGKVGPRTFAKLTGDNRPCRGAICYPTERSALEALARAVPRRKKRSPPVSVAVACIRLFAETGDLTPLGIAADSEEENGRPSVARVAYGRADPAIHAFYSHGCGITIAGEAPEVTRLRIAVALARAEQWARDVGAWAEWEVDEDWWPVDYDGGLDVPDIVFGCIIRGHPDHDTITGAPNSLWGITFDGDGEPWNHLRYSMPGTGGPGEIPAWPSHVEILKPYARVVCAELCLELMPDNLLLE